MGLTVKYDISITDSANGDAAFEAVKQMHELALDLPFEEVGDVVDLRGDMCDLEKVGRDSDLAWLLVQARTNITLPWNKRYSRRVNAERIIAFTVLPGEGCESAEIGLAIYPDAIEVIHDHMKDARYEDPKTHEFSWKRWIHHDCGRQYQETTHDMVPVKRSGWSWTAFCKTQYASDPNCGGLPNFLSCHISLVTLLERIGKLAGVKVRIDDEGQYGRSYYSDNWKEARAAGREPTYIWHKATHSPKVLVEQVCDYNEFVATLHGVLSDMCSDSKERIVSPVAAFPNFEKLEAEGLRKSDDVNSFVQYMRMIVQDNRASNTV